MKKVIIIVVLLLGAAAGHAYADSNQLCPLHEYAYCNNTYQRSPNYKFEKWHCTCGDDVWVRAK